MIGKESVHFTSGYRKERLPFGNRNRIAQEAEALRQIREEEETPDRIRQMKTLYYDLDPGRYSEGERFYRQARFMADYEDTYRYRGLFRRYFPTYSAMSGEQLRGYFGFRTRFRKGTPDTEVPISFVYVYAYELINGVGVTAEEGFSRLKELKEQYGEKDIALAQSLISWIRDYIVYYNLGKEAAAEFYDLTSGEHFSSLFQKTDDKGSDEELFAVLSELSSYPISKSQFYKKNPELIHGALNEVWRALSDWYELQGGDGLAEKCCGIKRSTIYRMFRSAVFYDHLKYDSYCYEISPALRFRHENNMWYKESFDKIEKKSSEIGMICRETDRILRIKTGFGRELKQTQTDQNRQDSEIISGAIDRYLKKNEEAKRPVVTIDISKLEEIRLNADLTRDALLVENSEEIDIRVTEPEEIIIKTEDIKSGDIISTEIESTAADTGDEAKNESMAAGAGDEVGIESTAAGAGDEAKTESMTAGAEDGAGIEQTAADTGDGSLSELITEEELFLLRSLLYNLPYRDHFQKLHVSVTILADQINDHLMDLFEDTVIEFTGEEPALVEDYVAELRRLFPEERGTAS